MSNNSLNTTIETAIWDDGATAWDNSEADWDLTYNTLGETGEGEFNLDFKEVHLYSERNLKAEYEQYHILTKFVGSIHLLAEDYIVEVNETVLTGHKVTFRRSVVSHKGEFELNTEIGCISNYRMSAEFGRISVKGEEVAAGGNIIESPTVSVGIYELTPSTVGHYNYELGPPTDTGDELVSTLTSSVWDNGATAWDNNEAEWDLFYSTVGKAVTPAEFTLQGFSALSTALNFTLVAEPAAFLAEDAQVFTEHRLDAGIAEYSISGFVVTGLPENRAGAFWDRGVTSPLLPEDFYESVWDSGESLWDTIVVTPRVEAATFTVEGQELYSIDYTAKRRVKAGEFIVQMNQTQRRQISLTPEAAEFIMNTDFDRHQYSASAEFNTEMVGTVSGTINSVTRSGFLSADSAKINLTTSNNIGRTIQYSIQTGSLGEGCNN